MFDLNLTRDSAVVGHSTLTLNVLSVQLRLLFYVCWWFYFRIADDSLSFVKMCA